MPGPVFVFSPRACREMRDWIAALEQRLRENPPEQHARYHEYPDASRGLVWERADSFAGLVAGFVADPVAA